MSDDPRRPKYTEQDALGSSQPQFLKLSPIATAAPSGVHTGTAHSQVSLQPRAQPRGSQQGAGSSHLESSRPRDAFASTRMFSMRNRGSRKLGTREMQAALDSFGRSGHLVELSEAESLQVDSSGLGTPERAARDAALSPTSTVANPVLTPSGSFTRRTPADISSAALTIHARAACLVSQRMQTSCSVSRFRQLKAMLLYSFLQADTDTISSCRTCTARGHGIDFGNLPEWFTSLSSGNADAAMMVPGERSPTNSEEPEEGMGSMTDEDQCEHLLAHVRALGKSGACGSGERSFQAYLFHIARGPSYSGSDWTSTPLPNPGGGPAGPLGDGGGGGSRFSDGGGLSDDGGLSGEGGMPKGLSGGFSGVSGGFSGGFSGGVSGGMSGMSVGTLGGDGSGGVEASTAWVEPLLQCIHTLEVWAVTMLDLTDLRATSMGGIMLDESSRELLHRRANKAKVGWGPLVVWLCLKVLARMFHVTMVLLETLATSEMGSSPVDMNESPVSTPTAGALQKHFSALPRSGSVSGAQGPTRPPGGWSTPLATPPGSPLSPSPSAFSPFGGPLRAHHNARWQLHVERVTERGLALISLIFRKLEALTQIVLSESHAKRFGLQLDRNHGFWGEVVHDILGEIALPRNPDIAGFHDTLKRSQKVVATLTFRKHLYALFPSGHHLSDDYCQLLVAHFRKLASCLCKSLAATNARLPDGSSPAKVKSWVTFLMGWESVAAAPRLLHIVEQARVLTEYSSVLLTQTQVLARMFPETNDCFLFLPGDLERLHFEGDVPSNIFALWVLFTDKVLGVLKQFATVWGQVSNQLKGTPAERAHIQRLQERHKIPDLANEMVRLGLFWRMHVPTHTLGMLKAIFKRLAEANRSRSMICSLISPPPTAPPQPQPSSQYTDPVTSTPTSPSNPPSSRSLDSRRLPEPSKLQTVAVSLSSPTSHGASHATKSSGVYSVNIPPDTARVQAESASTAAAAGGTQATLSTHTQCPLTPSEDRRTSRDSSTRRGGGPATPSTQ